MTCTRPLASVVPDAALSRPLSAEKFTAMPDSAAFELSTTVAVMVVEVELSDATVVADALSVICATMAFVPVPVEVNPKAVLVTVLPLTVAVAVTESAPVCVPAVRMIVAVPLASVSAVPATGESAPNVVPVVLNVTTMPDSAAPEPFLSVAVSVEGVDDETVVVVPETVSVGEAAVGVVAFDDPDPPPPHAVNSASSANANNVESARAEWIFNMCSCNSWIAMASIVMPTYTERPLDQTRYSVSN